MSEYTAVASTGPSAAFFDLDRTLISGSSMFALARSARAAGLVPVRQFVSDASKAVAFKLRGADDDTSAGVRERILGAVRGVRQDDILALNEDVIPRLLGRIRPEARLLIDRHRHAGRATYIVSASPQELVGPLAVSLGMTGGIGTISEVVDGLYTGKLAGPFCYGEGKVDAIAEVARWESLDLGQCYAYSDSASDLPMLRAVGHAVAVNPDAKLAREAALHGWPVVVFSRRTKAVIRRTTAAVGTAGVAATSFAAGWRLAKRSLG